MDVFTELAISDIQHAADILRPVHERTSVADGYVSLEVPPVVVPRHPTGRSPTRAVALGACRPPQFS